MKMLIVIAMLCFAAPVTAQTVEMPMDSPWVAWPRGVTPQPSVSALRKTSSGMEAITGQRVALGEMNFKTLQSSTTFPGQKTSPMPVAGLRIYYSAKGVGWAAPEHVINVALPTTLVVPAGRKMTCIYSAPMAGVGKLACSVT